MGSNDRARTEGYEGCLWNLEEAFPLLETVQSASFASDMTIASQHIVLYSTCYSSTTEQEGFAFCSDNPESCDTTAHQTSIRHYAK